MADHGGTEESFSSVFASLCEAANSSNVTSYLWVVGDKTSGRVLAALLIPILVLGLPWNILVVLTIFKENLYNHPTIILLLNLVMCDLIMLVLVLPVLIVTGIAGEFILGETDQERCKVCQSGIITSLFSFVSVSTISLMAIDRFLFIYVPLKYDSMVTSIRVLVALVLVWIASILIAILPLVGFGDIAFHPPFLSCQLDVSLDRSYYSLLVFIVALIPIIILVVFNVGVVYIVQKNIRAIYKVRKTLVNEIQRKSHDENLYKIMKRKRHKKQLHLLRVFGALFCSNLVSWLPTTLIILCLLILGDLSNWPDLIFAGAHLLFMSQLSVHPIIETTLLSNVREPMKKLFRCPCFQNRRRLISSKQTSSSSFSDAWSGCGSCCHGDSVMSQSGGCGFMNVCGAAVFSHHSDVYSENENTIPKTDNV